MYKQFLHANQCFMRMKKFHSIDFPRKRREIFSHIKFKIIVVIYTYLSEIIGDFVHLLFSKKYLKLKISRAKKRSIS